MKMHVIKRCACVVFFLTAVTPLADSALQQINVYPPDINLNTSRDHQSLVVQAVFADETTRDVTSACKLTLADASLVRQEGFTFYPVKDGATELTVEHAGHVVKVAVKVAKVAEDRPVSFRLDVMPVFMKSGCNTGACHGSARGQDMFGLSLFGFDPGRDYHSLTREMSGRRINLAVPQNSFIIQKGLGLVPHTGGESFKPGSEYHKTLIRWLKAGAPDDAPDVAHPVTLDIMPNRIVLEGENQTHQVSVRAKYSDGSVRDVTSLAVFNSNNEPSVEVSKLGLITGKVRGEAFVLARFETFNVGAQVIVIPQDPTYTFPDIQDHNYIDTLVHTKLKKLRMVPSDISSDEVFLRRVFVDITGTLPSEQDYNSFMASTDPKKRELLVDQLLQRKEFVEIWVMKWAELLQIRSSNETISYKAALLYYNWLQEKISNNVPINEIVKEVLASTGGTFKNPATNYYQIERDTLKTSENVAQVFMGTRIQCSQCHNHPFDRWTMNDYYSFANFFSRIGRKRAEDPRETIVFDQGSGETKHPVTGKPLPPKFLGGEEPKIADAAGRRKALAEWLTAPDNPWFSRNLANITWAHFFGQGIVEPVDDVRVTNPASNPELRDALGKKLVEYNYDFKKLVRDITLSRTYQLSTQANETNALDQRNFAKASIRRMRAEVLLDVITQVTGTKNKFQGLPLGARAVQIADGSTSTYFLTTFGRATRETVCSCEVSMDPNLSQALHLLNGDNVHKKVKQGNYVKLQLDAKRSPEQIIDQLYLRTLSRKPTSTEKEKLLAELAKDENKQAVLEDTFWALLNAKEFSFNH
ncbi:MAG: hypothetical protein ACI97B_001731 [Verrucomicrobiales bacterium]|jgi:hypothetical protein